VPTKLAAVLVAIPCQKLAFKAVYRDMIRANPSTHWPVDPEMPARLYPRGGINVCLEVLVKVAVRDLVDHLPRTTMWVTIYFRLSAQVCNDLYPVDPKSST